MLPLSPLLPPLPPSPPLPPPLLLSLIIAQVVALLFLLSIVAQDVAVMLN
jgi:hypothetical protein